MVDRNKRTLLLLLIDSLIIMTSIIIGNYLISGGLMMSAVLRNTLVSTVLFAFFGRKFGLYKKLWEYASIPELLTIFKIILATNLITVLTLLAIHDNYFIKLMVVVFMIQLLLIGTSRFFWLIFRGKITQKSSKKTRTLIIGAGSAGNMITRQLMSDRHSNLLPVGYLDDNSNKHQLELGGLPILGYTHEIRRIAKENQIDHVIIAIPSASKEEMDDILRHCATSKLNIQTLPRIEDLAEGKIAIADLHEISPDELLGRKKIELEDSQVSLSIHGKTVLVTGAGGSIGSEICRQVLEYQPQTLVLLGHGENSIYSIEQELSALDHATQLVTEIADVRDRAKIDSILAKHQPAVIYHAAAHKHVPLMELNPEEAVKNNVLGTKNVAELAKKHKAEKFILISSDKAVNPTNIMGATKRAAEMVVSSVSLAAKDTVFATVRFGNVLGSRGSVIPKFKEQIRKGGPVTVTHPEMIRYFMTIPEASRLVIQAGALANGGEIFVLDMGEPVKIVDLAKNLILKSGKTIEEIGIEYTGIRPGEKLYEELLMEEEGLTETSHEKIFVGKHRNFYKEEVDAQIKRIVEVLNNPDMVRQRLKEMVPTFQETVEQPMPQELVQFFEEYDKENVVEADFTQTSGQLA